MGLPIHCLAQQDTNAEQHLHQVIRQSPADEVRRAFPRFMTIDPVIALTIPCLPPVCFWEGNRISSGYGWRQHPISGRHAHHTGIDIAGTYQHIRAAATGIVIGAGYETRLGYFVRLDHQNGYQSTYGHLSALLVRTGQAVTVGERIGILGRSGAATGLHLHYSISKNGTPIDPAPYLTLGIELVNWYQQRGNSTSNVPTK